MQPVLHMTRANAHNGTWQIPGPSPQHTWIQYSSVTTTYCHTLLSTSYRLLDMSRLQL